MSEWQPIETLPPNRGGCVGIAHKGSYARLAYLKHGSFTFANPVEPPPSHWVDLAKVEPDIWPRLVDEMMP